MRARGGAAPADSRPCIRETDQLRRRYALPVPVEVRYDDYTPDTPENRLLRTAVLVARRLPGLDLGLRHRLVRLDVQLADVTPGGRVHWSRGSRAD